MTEEPAGSDRSAAAERRSRLVGVKLRALVRDHLSDDSVVEASGFAPGAALVHAGTAWVYLDENPAGRLGAAMAWALRAGVGGLHVIAESGSGILARRAGEFTFPINVWHNEERALWPAVPEPFAPVLSPPSDHLRFRDLIESSGADPLVEHGVLSGEVRGLEVCRVVDDAYTGDARLEVGIGAHDRDAFTMIHGDVPTEDALARVVATVESHRRLDAPLHPFNRLARERLVRWRLMQEPSLVGANELHPVEPPVPRRNLKDPVPCVAGGGDAAGRDVVVVCSVGVDLDLIPYAADSRLATATVAADGHGERSRLVVVTPARDRIKVIDEIGDLVRHSCEFVSAD